MLHVKDFIRSRTLGSSQPLSGMTRSIAAGGATTSATETVALFKKQRIHARGLVVDELWRHAGLCHAGRYRRDLIDEENV